MTYRILFAGLAACLFPAAAPATTYARLTTADLVRRAARVSCAACESCVERLDPASGVVFTHVRLRLLEDLKGRTPGPTIRLRIVGGTDRGVRTVVAGMPRFEPGKESVLLLGRPNALGYPPVLQGRFGVLPLRRDRSGSRVVAARLTGIEGLENPARTSLDALRGAVRAIVEEQEAAQR